MNHLRLQFLLWLPGNAAPDLSSIAEPVRVPVQFYDDVQPSPYDVSSEPAVTTEGKNA